MNRPQGYRTFFMLNSAEHEIFSANKFISKEIFYAQLCLARNFLILLVICRTNFMLSCVEHEKSFIMSGPDLLIYR